MLSSLSVSKDGKVTSQTTLPSVCACFHACLHVHVRAQGCIQDSGLGGAN